VKVKVRINQNGVLLISSAQMIEKKDVQDDQNGGEAEPQSPSEPSPTGDAAQTPGTEPMDTQEVCFASFFSSFFPPTDFISEKPPHHHKDEPFC
jgi:hypothetical protein